jgi:simple sugar transport system permease protein
MSVGAESVGQPLWASPAVARAAATFGIALGILAFWLALPPVAARSVAVPILIGVAAIALGLWAASQGDRRPGWGAVAAGLLGMTGGILAMHAAVPHLNAVIIWPTLLAATLRFATPLTFAAIGGLFSERSGVVNIGLEGMMLMGAFFGAWGADRTGSWEGGLFIGMAAGAALALVHAFFSVHLQADQIVSGTAVNFLALGITGYLYIDIYGDRGTPNDLPQVPDVNIGWLDKIPPKTLGNFLEDALGGLNLLVWVAFVLVIVTYLVIFKTPLGLHLRSVGEHPRAADTVGISVYGVRYLAVATSGILAALGGAFLSIGFTGTFSENMTSGRGFIALAAVIFGKWRPGWAFVATLLFGFGFALSIPLQRAATLFGEPVSANLLSTLPYILTLIAVAGLIGRSIPPAAIGRPYVKQ